MHEDKTMIRLTVALVFTSVFIFLHLPDLLIYYLSFHAREIGAWMLRPGAPPW